MAAATNIPTPLAFSPGSVTGFFLPNVGASPADTSSPGIGICISHGVTAALRPAASVGVRFNGRDIDFPPVRGVIRELAPEPVEVFLETPVPLGCGFGISAASCLATAFALDRRYDLGKTRCQLGEVVLEQEIRNRTGIGDPVSQLHGGAVWRRWQTGPFDASALAVSNSPLHYRVFGPISTKSVLSNPPLLKKLADEGRRCLAWLEQHRDDVTLDQILDQSLTFAQNAGLLTDERVIAAIEAVHRRGGQAAMIMLGQSVLANRLPQDPAGWQECTIDSQGTRYL